MFLKIDEDIGGVEVRRKKNSKEKLSNKERER